MNYSSLDVFFEKKFSFEKENCWTLPPLSDILVADLWTSETLQGLKSELNSAKSVLNDKGEQWHEHTSNINKAKLVIKSIKQQINPDILTQAWCKFYEVLSNYSLIPTETMNIKSLHLCEAPGAFISALNSYLYLNHPGISWEWLANTLNPYYEGQNIKNVVVDDRLIFPTLRNWYFGSDSTGDIMEPGFRKIVKKYADGQGFFDLVTADGSVNCLEDPAEQETKVAPLHFAEMLVALSNLAIGGSFVLKKFTFFECETICKMYFLNCVFKEVHVFKPFTSKHGNSEVYVVCLGYQGAESLEAYFENFSEAYNSKKDRALFPLPSIPESFISQLVKCSNYFIDLQKNAIIENIQLFSQDLSSYEIKLEETQKECAEKYLIKCNILSDNSLEIPKLYNPQKQILTSFYDRENRSCKTLFFQALGETYENLSKFKSMDWPDVITDIDKRINACFPVNKKRPHKDLEWCPIWKEVNNRMKSKSYKNWFTLGKKISKIENSKFCNPFILHLWNRVSHNPEIDLEMCTSNDCCYWDIDHILPLITESKNIEELSIIFMQSQNDEFLGKDSLLVDLLKAISCSYSCNFTNLENQKTNWPDNNRIVYINSTSWGNSLHLEMKVKYPLTENIKNIIKILSIGDTLILCIQSLLTRYTIGIIFMLLSLFEKFVCCLPNDLAPPMCGQLWIFKNFKKPAHTNRLIDYMEFILRLDVPEDREVLEIVPIASLCGGHLYEYLLTLNNHHMLQKLRSLISIEKCKLKR
ncbi:hypothetical protein JTE90_028182 [Oedothorax gibbosus]|uniref:Cap-specific mRNA (nucleoside-2'-O-)-methyltransferase 2 n=1 Tax=Oedothorax gibbosus TaxID=931172 RepID=A0AAV6UF15_9ARAC|nr:hypothetical protein JTE90_028182 [Oedothorax gibbosus]